MKSGKNIISHQPQLPPFIHPTINHPSPPIKGSCQKLCIREVLRQHEPRGRNQGTTWMSKRTEVRMDQMVIGSRGYDNTYLYMRYMISYIGVITTLILTFDPNLWDIQVGEGLGLGENDIYISYILWLLVPLNRTFCYPSLHRQSPQTKCFSLCLSQKIL